MGRGRGISLKGAAAGAFIDSLMGKKPATEDDKYMRIVTFIHMEMKKGTKEGEHRAKLIVQCLSKEGLDKTLEYMTGIKAEPPPAPPPAPPAE